MWKKSRGQNTFRMHCKYPHTSQLWIIFVIVLVFNSLNTFDCVVCLYWQAGLNQWTDRAWRLSKQPSNKWREERCWYVGITLPTDTVEEICCVRPEAGHWFYSHNFNTSKREGDGTEMPGYLQDQYKARNHDWCHINAKQPNLTKIVRDNWCVT